MRLVLGWRPVDPPGAIEPADALNSVSSVIVDNVEKVARIQVSALEPAGDQTLLDPRGLA